MIWHVLADDDAVFEDLGADWFERRTDPAAHTRRLVRELEEYASLAVTHGEASDSDVERLSESGREE